MVEPSLGSRTIRLVILGMALSSAGCSVVPRSRLEDCHKLSQTLEADKSRLNDTILTQRSQYSDLAQRADDDARRLRIQSDENKRLLASVQAYQDERDQLAADFARVKSLLQVSANPVSATLLQRFDRFAKANPGCEFDSISGVLTIPADTLFKPGDDALKPSALPLLQSLADSLDNPESKELRLLVAGHTEDSQVRQTSLQSEDGSAQGHLSLDRASRVRDRLALEANFDPARIEVAGFESSAPIADGPDEASRTRNRRIEIRLLGTPTGPATLTGP